MGRIAALENKPFNQYHDAKDAEFYLFECVNDQEVANALFETVMNWAKDRGLTKLVGPRDLVLWMAMVFKLKALKIAR